MAWTSILAIYVLFWTFSAFILLPFGIRPHSEQEGIERIPGQADSAPVNFRPRRLIVRATILSALLCGAYVANYTQGWIKPADLDLFGDPPGWKESQEKYYGPGAADSPDEADRS